METKEFTALENKHKEAISKYIESRLGVYGVNWYEFKWELTPKYSFKEYAEQSLKPKSLGIIRHMMTSCVLHLKVWGDDFPKTVEVGFSYQHPGGGSNGADADIRLRVSKDASVFEVSE